MRYLPSYQSSLRQNTRCAWLVTVSQSIGCSSIQLQGVASYFQIPMEYTNALSHAIENEYNICAIQQSEGSSMCRIKCRYLRLSSV